MKNFVTSDDHSFAVLFQLGHLQKGGGYKEALRAQTYLVKDWILGLEAGANKLDDLLVRARLLPTELVAWERKDLKT